MRLPINKTKLRAPGYTSFYALREIVYPDYITLLPDLTAVTGPRNKLQELVYECTDALDTYSRFLGRNPDAEGALESALLLPVELWQDSARRELDTLVTTVAKRYRTGKLHHLCKLLDSAEIALKARNFSSSGCIASPPRRAIPLASVKLPC